MKISKRQKSWTELFDKNKKHSLVDSITIMKSAVAVKFKETIDIAVKIGVDPRKSDQIVRGSCTLPHGTGKKERILVFAKGEKISEAKDAGADFCGGIDLIEKIKEGWLEFDRVVATPDMMVEVGKIGKILGPRSLMPNPKVGTVTFEVAQIINEIKKGQVEFKNDKDANVHLPVGKIDFENNKIAENIHTVLDTIIKLKPSVSKGIYIQKVVLNSTMGPGIEIDTTEFTK